MKTVEFTPASGHRRWSAGGVCMRQREAAIRALPGLAVLLGACGGGGDDIGREHVQGVQLPEGVFSRNSVAFVQDWEGVWIPLEVDEPGYVGGRRVKNLYLNSDDAANWSRMPDGKSAFAVSGPVGTITHTAGQNGSPYFTALADGGLEPGAMPASLFASRVTARIVSGPCTQRFTYVGRTNGTAIGSESNNPAIAVADCNWHTFSQTAQQFENHSGYIATLLTQSTVAKSYELKQMQFEDVTGARTPVSGEYCPSSSKPGVCWFAGAPQTTRTGALYDEFTATNAFNMGGGLLTEASSTAFAGQVALEPASTNVIPWNTHNDVGVAVVDSSSNNYPQAAPGLSCTDYVLTDPRSGRYVYNKNDFTVLGPTLTSKTTDLSYFRPGSSVWLHVGGTGSWGPFTVLASGARALTVSSALPALAKGTKLNLHRIPQVGDPIMIRRNNGAMHYSSVSAILLPSVGAAAADGYQHTSVRLQLADPFPCDGVNSGRVGNENQPVYYGKALVYDMAGVREAGLGYIVRNGLVLQVTGSHAFAGTGVTGSAWVKGSGVLCVGEECVPFETGTYTRVSATGFGSMSVTGSALVAVPQLEMLPFPSSPIVTGASPAARAATQVGEASTP